MEAREGGADNDVAIIGMAGRFPGATDVREYWENIAAGVECISVLSDDELERSGVPREEYRSPDYVKARGVLEGADLFDAGFFGYSPREAQLIDPQQRVLLECAWHALEDAGYDTERYDGLVGVYAGATLSHYLLTLTPQRELLRSLEINPTSLAIANFPDSLATRIAFNANLRGPAVTVQTACSTSLVAVHMACQAVLGGECDMALAGGVSISLPIKSGYLHLDGGFLSPDGHCRAFDRDANGTVYGSGAGLVVLKRLDDALAEGDSIYAVIKGSAINNDGSFKVGYTAPSVDGQAEVISEALAAAGVDPRTIGYVEAHGTGTEMGDPIEIAALSKAYRSGSRANGAGDDHPNQYCAIGSVKTNIGHLEAAAGVAGLIKAALALHHGVVPASLHFEAPNRAIDFAASPFYVSARRAEWSAPLRRAAVSAFGFGGTNAHAVLEQSPVVAREPSLRRSQLLLLSARSSAVLDQLAGSLASDVRGRPNEDLADLAHTLRVGRRQFDHRRFAVVDSSAQAADALEGRAVGYVASGVSTGRRAPVAFMFPGQGTQYPNMTRGLYETEPTYRDALDRCAALADPHLERPLLDVLFPEDGDAAEAARRLEQTAFAQPALFAVEYALAELWESWGVRADAMIGHSIGEYVAACRAGVFGLEEATALVAARGRLIQEQPPGGMLAVPCAESELRGLLERNTDVALAAVNGPSLCVLSGSHAALERAGAQLEREGIETRHVHTSHAFHSSMMDPVEASFRAEVSRVSLAAPSVRLISNLSGSWLTDEEATDPGYWTRHLRGTVRFGDGLSTLVRELDPTLLEVGPGRGLCALATSDPVIGSGRTVCPSVRHPRDDAGASGGDAEVPPWRSDTAFVQQALGRLWLAGQEIDWDAVQADERRRRLSLPPYPFARRRHWLGEAVGGPFQAPLTTTAGKEVATSPKEVEKPTGSASESAGESVGASADESASLGSNEPRLRSLDDLDPTRRIERRYEQMGDAEGPAFVAPRNDIERILADVYQTLLGVERVGVDDNFFALGGHSLTALQALPRIRESLQVRLKVRHFFEAPTVRELAELADEMQPGADDLAARSQILDELLAETEAGIEEAPARLRAEAPALPPAPAMEIASSRPGGAMKFSLFFFSGDELLCPDDKYRLVIEGAKFADQNGWESIWTPERHLHRFGGLYANPSIIAASLATVTERLGLRAGSVVAPIHHPARIVEEWSIVDNLSRGRVGLSVATGFHPSDFIFAPGTYEGRREKMWEKLEIVRRLWRGETLVMPDGLDREIEVQTFPRPVQPELPVWVTCGTGAETFERAGELGANVLTALIGIPLAAMEDRIAAYRRGRERAGLPPEGGEVSVMLHTYLADDLATARRQARAPFIEYLRSHTNLLASLSRKVGASEVDAGAIVDEDLDELLDLEFERYFSTASLMGTVDTAHDMVRKLSAAGVTEACCLVDFGIDIDTMLRSLRLVDELKQDVERESRAVDAK